MLKEFRKWVEHQEVTIRRKRVESLSVQPSNWSGGFCEIQPSGNRAFTFRPASFGAMNCASSGPADTEYSGGKPDVRYTSLR